MQALSRRLAALTASRVALQWVETAKRGGAIIWR